MLGKMNIRITNPPPVGPCRIKYAQHPTPYTLSLNMFMDEVLGSPACSLNPKPSSTRLPHPSPELRGLFGTLLRVAGFRV